MNKRDTIGMWLTRGRRPPRGSRAGALMLVGLLLGLVGCAGDAPEPAAEELRLVSLAPSLTQMLIDLELADRLVGVAEHDAPAPSGLPVVGNYADVHTERLIELAPTHVLTLTTARDAPRRLRELADAGRFELVAYPFPFTLDDVRRTLHHDDDPDDDDRPASLGVVLGVPERARQLVDRLDGRLDRLRALTADRERPRVLMIIGNNPVMASGRGTVHDELLGWIGARNAAADARVTAPTYDREGLLTLSPDVILLLSPDAPPLRPGDARLAVMSDLPLPAIENERVYLIDHPLTLLASTSLPAVAAEMARAIHPDLADEIDAWAQGGE